MCVNQFCALAESAKKIEELTTLNAELKLTVDGLEKERDFYFGKLRDIEIMLQSKETDEPKPEVVEEIFKILYATEDDFAVENGDEAPAAEAHESFDEEQTH